MNRLESADFVVIGSGAGGATAARRLMEDGHDVLILESGSDLRQRERPRALVDGLAQSLRDFGGQTTRGLNPMVLLQGHCVGGSTAVNSGITWRLPSDVKADWKARFGLSGLIDDGRLAPIEERLERLLGVTRTNPEVMGENAKMLARGAAGLGLPGRATDRNASECRGSAQCLQGCPHQARQSMDVSFIPWCTERGARLQSDAPVRRVGRNRSGHLIIEGTRREGQAHQAYQVRAGKGVILAAGALHTPIILRSSGVRRHVGDHFQAHPGVAVVGKFPHPVDMGTGATQGYEVPMRSRGFKIESLSLPPEMIAARIPGVGADWAARVADLSHYGQLCVQVRMEAEGKVRSGWGGRPSVTFEPTARDMSRLAEAALLMVRLMLEAGAEEVYPGIGCLPAIVRGEEDLPPRIERPRRGEFRMVASHLFGTARAGHRGAGSVVDARLEAYEFPGLYVMDASVFPTNLGVNPQHAIMSVAWSAADYLAACSTGKAPRRALP